MDDLTALLLEARRGDRAALEEFVRRTEPEIRRFCARIVGEREADDATQETYVAAWRALAAFRHESSARTWLYAIARRTASRCGRRSERWSELAARPDRAGAGGDVAHDGSSRLELDDLLGVLDVDRRTALVLTQVIGFSYAEAAEICACAIGTIRSRVARARADLLEHERRTGRSAGADAG